MRIAAGVNEEAIGVMAAGQIHRKSFQAMHPQTMRKLAGRLLSAAIVIGVESHVDLTRVSIEQLTHLRSIQASSHRTGGVAKSRSCHNEAQSNNPSTRTISPQVRTLSQP